MEIVIAQRALPTSADASSLQALAATMRDCCEQNRVKPVRSHLSLDGYRTICVFESPDAEAVRRVSRQAQMPGDVWTADLHVPQGAPAADGDLIVVERSFDAPGELDELQAREDRGAWCLEQYRVRFVRTYFARDRRRMICLYAAPDAESVRAAQRTIGMPVDLVWASRLVGY